MPKKLHETQAVASVSAQAPPAPNQKKGKNASQVPNPLGGRKHWNPVEFLKLYKKYEDLTLKPL